MIRVMSWADNGGIVSVKLWPYEQVKTTVDILLIIIMYNLQRKIHTKKKKHAIPSSFKDPITHVKYCRKK